MRFPWGVKVLLGTVTVCVLAAVGFGIYLAGSPSLQRSIRLDEQRVGDLENITWAIDEYWQTNEALPVTLDDLRGARIDLRSITDPDTEEQYEYRTLSGPGYELCAVFETDSPDPRPGSSRSFSDSVWEHGKGRTCFEHEAKPTVLSPTPSP